MTDDELTKEAERLLPCWQSQAHGICGCPQCVIRPRILSSLQKARVAGYAEAVEDMGKVEGAAAKGLDALRTAKAQGLTQGYEEAREQAVKIARMCLEHSVPEDRLIVMNASLFETLNSMKPGANRLVSDKRLEAAEKVCEAAEKEQLSHFEAQGGYHSTVEVLEALKEWWKVIGRVAPYK